MGCDFEHSYHCCGLPGNLRFPLSFEVSACPKKIPRQIFRVFRNGVIGRRR